MGAGTLRIWLAGPHIAHKYWQKPEAFLRMGDPGFMCDGQMFVADRLKDLMTVRRVDYPQDIEAAANRPSGAAALTFDDGTRERVVVVVAEVKRSARCNAVGHSNSIWLASSWCSMRPNPASGHERSPTRTMARS